MVLAWGQSGVTGFFVTPDCPKFFRATRELDNAVVAQNRSDVASKSGALIRFNMDVSNPLEPPVVHPPLKHAAYIEPVRN